MDEAEEREREQTDCANKSAEKRREKKIVYRIAECLISFLVFRFWQFIS